MTKFTKDKIFEKLESLKEYRQYLRELKNETKSEKDFVSDFHLFGNVERYLQLSIQAIIDITHLIIIDLDLRRPNDNYEAISMIYHRKIISAKLSSLLTGMVGLRNILVHEYGKIDRKKVYKILTTRLSDLDQFQKAVITYLKK